MADKVTAFWVDWLTSQNLIKRDVDSEILRVAPIETPISSSITPLDISEKMWWGVKTEWIRTVSTTSFVKEQVEKEYIIPSTLLATAIASNATLTIDVTVWEWKNFVEWDVIRVVDIADTTWQTYEQMLVASVATDTLTVTRWLWASTALATIWLNSIISRVGSAFWEWSSAPAATTQVSQTNTYNVQLFRTSISATEEAIIQETYAWQVWEDEKAEKAIQHKIDFEKAILFSEKWDIIDINWSKWYTTQWIVPSLRDSAHWLVDTITWPLTEAKLHAFMDDWFKYWKWPKVLFCSWTVQNQIAQFSSDVRRVSPEDSKFWYAVTEYFTPAWTIQVIRHSMFTAENWMESAWVLLDMSNSLQILQHTKWWTTFKEHPQVAWSYVKSWDYSTRKWLMFNNLRNNRMFYLV